MATSIAVIAAFISVRAYGDGLTLTPPPNLEITESSGDNSPGIGVGFPFTFTLTNNTGAAITLTGRSVSGAFIGGDPTDSLGSVRTTIFGGGTCPLVVVPNVPPLGPGESCTLMFTYLPNGPVDMTEEDADFGVSRLTVDVATSNGLTASSSFDVR